MHPHGVTIDKARTDLWPDGNKIGVETIRAAFYGARRWCGRGLEGDPDQPFVSNMAVDHTYRLSGHLLDWDLFRRLRKRGAARHAAGHPGAITDYETALGLVRGPALTRLRPGGYAWLYDHQHRHDLHVPGVIADTAHELVDIALAAGDPELARRTAERARALDVDTTSSWPLVDLMRIASMQGNRSELERLAAVLLKQNGAEVGEDLPTEVFAVFDALLPDGLGRRSA